MKIPILCVAILSLTACKKSSGGDESPPEGQIPAELIPCVRKELGKFASFGPYEAIDAYRACGGADSASDFGKLSQELFLIESGQVWKLK